MSWSTNNGTWINRSAGTRCSVLPVAFVVALQTVARNALRGPWGSWDGSHPTRPTIDGTWGPVTAAAAYTLAKMRGANDATLNALRESARTRAVTPEALQAAIWITYYQPRAIDLDVSGVRVQRTDPAELGIVDLDRIEVPSDTLKFGVRPDVPVDMGVLGARPPVCAPIGAGVDLGSPGAVSAPVPARSPVRGGGSGVLWLAGALALYLASRRKKGR